MSLLWQPKNKGGGKMICKKCGSSNLELAYWNNHVPVWEFYCNDCGFISKTNELFSINFKNEKA